MVRYERATGMLDLTREGRHRRIYFVDGRPVFMQSSAEGENVATLLHHRGRLSARDLERCWAYMGDRRRTMQQSLLELRLVSAQELATAYKLLAGRLLPPVVGLPGGRFVWQPTDAFRGRIPEGLYDPVRILFEGIAKHLHPPQVFSLLRGREDEPLFATPLIDELAPGFRAAFPQGEFLLDEVDGTVSARRLTALGDPVVVLPPLYALLVSGMACIPGQGGVSTLERAIAAAFDDEALAADTAETPAVGATAAEAQRRLEAQDFFEVLGVSREATQDELRAAYLSRAYGWRLSRDQARARARSSGEVDAILTRVTEAYTTLADPDQRAAYVDFLERRAAGPSGDERARARASRLTDDALSLLRRGDARGARDLLEVAASLAPEPDLQLETARRVFADFAHDPPAVDLAAALLKRIVRAHPALAVAHQRLGSIAHHRGEADEARKWWSRCLELDPEDEVARRGLRAVTPSSSRSSGFFERLRGKRP